jgi:sortase A
MTLPANPPSSGLLATISRQRTGEGNFIGLLPPLAREKVHGGRMSGNSRRTLLNLFSVLCVIGAIAMLGKSCWITLKAEVAQVLLDRAFTQSVMSGESVKPWGWADTWPVAEVRVPRLSSRAVVLHGATGEALAFGPTWLPDTAKPGERGTTVLAAHRDTHFAFLKDVKVGDVIEVARTDGLTFQYRVSRLRVATWNASGLDRHAPGHHLALTTCWPLDGLVHGPERLIVEAAMVH